MRRADHCRLIAHLGGLVRERDRFPDAFDAGSRDKELLGRSAFGDDLPAEVFLFGG